MGEDKSTIFVCECSNGSCMLQTNSKKWDPVGLRTPEQCSWGFTPKWKKIRKGRINSIMICFDEKGE